MIIGEAPTYVTNTNEVYKKIKRTELYRQSMKYYNYSMSFGFFNIVFDEETPLAQEYVDKYVDDYIEINGYKAACKNEYRV